MITWHNIKAKEAFDMYGELLNEYLTLLDQLLPTLDRWTEHERKLLNGAMTQSDKAVAECGVEMAGLEGDARSIVIRKHFLRAITLTRLAIRFLNNTSAKYADAPAPAPEIAAE